MFKRLILALTVIGVLAMAGMPSTAMADRRHGHHGHHHGHWHGHWRHRPIVYPPIYYGGYYPVRTYYATPYYGPYGDFGYYGGPYYGYYGSGVQFSVGW